MVIAFWYNVWTDLITISLYSECALIRVGMIRLELPEYGVREKNLGQHNRTRKARQKLEKDGATTGRERMGERKGGKGTNQDLEPEEMHLSFQKLESKRKGIGSAKPHGDERQRNRKEAAAVARFRNQVFEERVKRQKMKPEQMGREQRTGGLTGGKRKEGSREKAAGQ